VLPESSLLPAEPQARQAPSEETYRARLGKQVCAQPAARRERPHGKRSRKEKEPE